MGNTIVQRNTAAFFLILMCVQYIPIEGFGISYLKVGAMCLSPMLLIIYSPKVSTAWLWGLLYCLSVSFSALFHPETFRFSTIGYLYAFVFSFLLFYNLVHFEKVFSLDFFIKLLRGLIAAYIVCLLLQQVVMLLGFRSMPPINLTYSLDRGIWGNSLALEPSHAARILAVAFLAFLRTHEIKNGTPFTLRELFGRDKWLTLGFLYAMVTLGSGTAFIALAIVCLYFFRKQYIAVLVPLSLALYLIIPVFNYEPLNRAVNTVETLLSDDPNQIVKEDRSAAVRIKPLINTFTNLDLTDPKIWFGEGTDASHNYNIYSKNFDKQMVGGINDYGLLSYLIGILFIATCCLPRFFSLETLLLFVLVGLTVNNFAYIWGIYMLLVPVKYFYQTHVLENSKFEARRHTAGHL